MRRTYMGRSWLFDEAGVLQGLACGSDAATEHEVGIRGILTAFGATKEVTRPRGIYRAQVSQYPEKFVAYGEYLRQPLHETNPQEPCAYLYFTSRGEAKIDNIRYALKNGQIAAFLRDQDVDVNPKKDEDTVCAWDEYGFVIHVRGAANIARLKDLSEALRNMDVSFSGPDMTSWRQAGGLRLLITSRIPPEAWLHYEQHIEEKEANQLHLDEAWEKIGIEAKLKAAGKRWFFLGPKGWADFDKTQPVAWLNPWEQHKYEAGYFTIADLEAWMREEGPIIKGA